MDTNDPDVKALLGRVAALEARPVAQPVDLTGLTQRIGALEARPSASGSVKPPTGSTLVGGHSPCCGTPMHLQFEAGYRSETCDDCGATFRDGRPETAGKDATKEQLVALGMYRPQGGRQSLSPAQLLKLGLGVGISPDQLAALLKALQSA